MTISYSKFALSLSAALFTSVAVPAAAETYKITLWAGGTGETSSYRHDAVVMAADLLEQEAKLRGETLDISVEYQTWNTWDDFKQAVTLASEAGNAPHIIISGHEDIGAWSRSGLLRPFEDYADLNVWPLTSIYPNLMEIGTYEGVQWGVPVDAEARPFFYSRKHMRAIGYSDEQIEALPQKVLSGEYKLYDVLADAKKMLDQGLVEPGFGFMPRPVNGTDWWQFYQSFGGEMVDADSGKLVFDTQALKEMYQFFADAVEMGVTSKTWIGTKWDDFHNRVSSDTVGTWHAGTWMVSSWETQYGLTDFFGQMQYSLIPAGNERGRANSITHPLVYLLSTSGTDAEAEIAAQLITVALEPRFMAMHAVKSGKVALGAPMTEIPLFAANRWNTIASNELVPHANAVPNDVEFSTLWTAMWRGLEASWTGVSSVDAAVEAAKAEVQGALGDLVIIR
jgi:inositol-phosphate transport system substrate-binding protein